MKSNYKNIMFCALAVAAASVVGCNNIYAKKPAFNSTDNVVEFTDNYAKADVAGLISLDAYSEHNHTDTDHNYWFKKDCWNSSEQAAIKYLENYCSLHGGEVIKREPFTNKENSDPYYIQGSWCRSTSAPYQPLFYYGTGTNTNFPRCGAPGTQSPYLSYEMILYTPKTGSLNTDEEWISFAKKYGFITKAQENEELAEKEYQRKAQELAAQKVAERQKRIRQEREKDAPLLLNPKYRGTQICSFYSRYGSLEDANPSNKKIKVLLSDGGVIWADAKDWYICGH